MILEKSSQVSEKGANHHNEMEKKDEKIKLSFNGFY